VEVSHVIFGSQQLLFYRDFLNHPAYLIVSMWQGLVKGAFASSNAFGKSTYSDLSSVHIRINKRKYIVSPREENLIRYCWVKFGRLVFPFVDDGALKTRLYVEVQALVDLNSSSVM
jgi:hypothetical protein